MSGLWLITVVLAQITLPDFARSGRNGHLDAKDCRASRAAKTYSKQSRFQWQQCCNTLPVWCSGPVKPTKTRNEIKKHRYIQNMLSCYHQAWKPKHKIWENSKKQKSSTHQDNKGKGTNGNLLKTSFFDYAMNNEKVEPNRWCDKSHFN